MPLNWIEHKGRRILHLDYRGVPESQMIDLVDQAVAALKTQGGKSRVLIDVSGASTGTRFMSASKGQAKEAATYLEKQAIVGVDGIKSILLKAYNTVGGGNLTPFETERQALDFLAK